jgi:metallo-beta-lactamase family protein
VKIDFLGAVGTVTGSKHVLSVNGSRILLDCGLYQGRRQESFDRNRRLPFDASAIDAMVLSHAHIDHSGNIPNLVRAGYRGNIHCTFATRDLCSYMLRDSAHIMESDAAYLNKKRRRNRQPLVEPIYGAAEATESLRYFTSMDYERQALLAPGVRLTFYDAGHILGSALSALDITEDGRSARLLYTGDLGRRDLPILCDPQPVPDVDYLIIESTYGGRAHGTPQDAERQLARVVRETHARGGKVIIPAFSVGRTQEVVYALHRLTVAGDIPKMPIYVDSPLSTNATEVFRLHPEYYDAETYAFMLEHRDPFGFSALRYLRHVEDSKALNERHEPMIIISASGMCESGRILHHLKNNIEDPRNTVLFVAFQAQHTLGRRIRDGAEAVNIFGGRYDVRARVEVIDGYSAHADHEELLGYVRRLGPERLRGAYIVHGEEEAALALKEGLEGLGVRRVVIPTEGRPETL